MSTLRTTLITSLATAGLAGLAVTAALGSGAAVPAAAASSEDRTLPVVRVEYPAADGNFGYWRRAVPVTITATDTGSGVDDLASAISLTGAQKGSERLQDGRASFTVSADGQTTISYAVSDVEGNVRRGSVELLVDQTPPSGAINGGDGVIRVGDVVRLTKLCGDFTGYTTCDWDGAVSADGVLDTSTPGSREVWLHVEDGAGNQRTVTRTFAVLARDARPTVELRAPSATGDAGWFTTSPVLTVTGRAGQGQPAVDHLVHRLDDGPETSHPGAEAEVTVPEGRHTLTVAAVDTDGVSSGPLTREVAVDTVDPRAAVTVPEVVAVGDEVRPDVTCVDATSGVARCDVVSGVDAHGLLDTSAAGELPVVVTVRDRAGNETDVTRRVVVAETAAAADSTTTARFSPAAAAGRGGTASVRVRAEGVAPSGRVVLLDGGRRIGRAMLTGGRATVRVPRLRPGVHRLVVRYLGSTDVAASSSRVLRLRVR